MIKLVDLYEFENRPREGALEFLYDIMGERLDDPYINISHTALPTWERHVNFVLGKPYRRWMLILAGQDDMPHDSGIWVGYVSATINNEIGIIIRKKWRGRGFGTAAVRKLIQTFQPYGAIPSRRSGAWLANINPENLASVRMFQKLGFRCAQATYKLDLSNAIEDTSETQIEYKPKEERHDDRNGKGAGPAGATGDSGAEGNHRFDAVEEQAEGAGPVRAVHPEGS